MSYLLPTSFVCHTLSFVITLTSSFIIAFMSQSIFFSWIRILQTNAGFRFVPTSTVPKIGQEMEHIVFITFTVDIRVPLLTSLGTASRSLFACFIAIGLIATQSKMRISIQFMENTSFRNRNPYLMIYVSILTRRFTIRTFNTSFGLLPYAPDDPFGYVLSSQLAIRTLGSPFTVETVPIQPTIFIPARFKTETFEYIVSVPIRFMTVHIPFPATEITSTSTL